MKFIVERTGLYDSRVPPCEGAVAETQLRADRRTLTTEEEFDARLGNTNPWRSQGEGHTFWDDGDRGGIVRFFPVTVWTLELEDLGKLLATEGKVQMRSPETPNLLPRLELGDFEN